MATKRTYEDACRFAHALDLVGERWSLLVVRELLLGPKRFTDLRRGLPHASPNVLTQRLHDLQDAGVLRRRKLPPPAGSQVYELTEWGAQLEPVVTELGRWGARAPKPPQATTSSLDAMAIALKSLFDPEAATGVNATYELHLVEDTFRVEVADGRIEIDRGEVERPDATIETDPATLGALLARERPLADALRSGDLEVDGGRAAAERFLDLFQFPEPVETVTA